MLKINSIRHDIAEATHYGHNDLLSFRKIEMRIVIEVLRTSHNTFDFRKRFEIENISRKTRLLKTGIKLHTRIHMNFHNRIRQTGRLKSDTQPANRELNFIVIALYALVRSMTLSRRPHGNFSVSQQLTRRLKIVTGVNVTRRAPMNLRCRRQ